jgi:hypothetical protein
MKIKNLRWAILCGVCLLLSFVSASFTYSVQSSIQIDPTGTAVLQTTGTPQLEDRSEVGSTDEIVVLGGIIVLIVVIPIYLRRKHWMRSTQE